MEDDEGSRREGDPGGDQSGGEDWSMEFKADQRGRVRFISLALIVGMLSVTTAISSKLKKMTFADIRGMNRQHVNQLSVGMTKERVLEVMGTESYRSKQPLGSGRESEIISNPFRTETLASKDGQATFEVLFYYTDLKKADGAITDDELTPLILQSGQLVGWGWSFMDQTVAKYEIRIR